MLNPLSLGTWFSILSRCLETLPLQGMALLPAGASDEERFQRGRAWRLLATVTWRSEQDMCPDRPPVVPNLRSGNRGPGARRVQSYRT